MNAPNEIKKLWQIIATADSSILEMRALWPAGIAPAQHPITNHFRAKNYPLVEARKSAFETQALKLNQDGYNIYIVMNPIAATFTGSAATDDDIRHRELLLIDIDRTAAKKEPATDDEVQAASDLAQTVRDYLGQLNWPEPIRVMSGNGHHLYYVLPDMPNDAQTKGLVQSLLKQLAAEFDNATVKIDTTVFNASRITKVVGTIARKGMESQGRPYRMAQVL